MYLITRLVSSATVSPAPQAAPSVPLAPQRKTLAGRPAVDRLLSGASRASGNSTAPSSMGSSPHLSPRPTPPPTGVATPQHGAPMQHKPHTLMARVWELMGERPNIAEQMSSIQ